MPISKYLNSIGIQVFEGYSQELPGQVKDLVELTNGFNINIMEIGFNAGHSAEVFLASNSRCTLTSFDLGIHGYVQHAKKYIDDNFPNRHNLILGDSTVTVPKFINDNPGKIFDVIFIDGGHDYAIANADLVNCKGLANADTVVIIDDTSYFEGPPADYTIGPTRTWTEHVKSGKIFELGKADYNPARGMSWGKYVF
jgi:predicted O-methyltransferase YrrM